MPLPERWWCLWNGLKTQRSCLLSRGSQRPQKNSLGFIDSFVSALSLSDSHTSLKPLWDTPRISCPLGSDLWPSALFSQKEGLFPRRPFGHSCRHLVSPPYHPIQTCPSWVECQIKWTYLLLCIYIYFNVFILFIYFWLLWFFLVVRRLSLVVASGGYSSAQCMGSRCVGFSSCRSRAQ